MQLFVPDSSPPGVSVLLEPEALSKRLRDWLGLGDLQIVNIRYKPGTNCLVAYRYEHEGHSMLVHAKAYPIEDWPQRRKKIPESAWTDDELGLVVFKFPDDAKVESLQDFHGDPREFLSRVLLDDQGFGPVADVTTLAYKPNRRYVAVCKDCSGKKAVVKLYGKSSFKLTLAAAATLKKLGLAGLPQRIGRSQRHRTLVFDWIDGDPLDVQRIDHARVSGFTEQVFGFLNRVHRPVNTQKFFVPVRSPLHGVYEIAQYLNLICKPLGAAAVQLLGEIEKVRPDYCRMSLVHGDFYDRQLLCRGDELFACDFDNLCVDDANVDAANFVAHLRYRRIAGAGNAAANEIDEAFRENVSTTSAPAVLRYQWNQAVALMRLATHPFRAGHTDWVPQTELILDEVRRLIRFSSNHTNTIDDSSVVRSKSICFRDDPSFDFLPELNIKRVNKVLKRSGSKLAKSLGNVAVAAVLPIRHKRGRRCMVEFVLATDRGMKSVLGKVSAKRLKKKAEKIQRQLFQKHGFNYQADDRIVTPQTYGCYKPWRMWFQEKVNARSAGELMAMGEFSPLVSWVAPAIKKLHQCKIKPHRTHFIADELEILTQRLFETQVRLPEQTSRIERIANRSVAIASRQLADLKMAPIHRDFYQDQILFDNDFTYLVDLDLLAFGPAVLDIGNFLAHLTEDGLRNHRDPLFWRDEEHAIAAQWLAITGAGSLRQIEACKAISFARHIAISNTISSRRHTTERIIYHTEYLMDKLHARQPSRPSLSLETIQTGELK